MKRYQEYGPQEAGPLGSAMVSLAERMEFLADDIDEVGSPKREGNLWLLRADAEHACWLIEQAADFPTLEVQRGHLWTALLRAQEVLGGAKIIGLISRESALSFATANVQ